MYVSIDRRPSCAPLLVGLFVLAFVSLTLPLAPVDDALEAVAAAPTDDARAARARVRLERDAGVPAGWESTGARA